MATIENLLTVETLKDHMRFCDADHRDEMILAIYLQAAKDCIEKYCGRTFSEMETPNENHPQYNNLPASIVLATLQLAAHFFEQREAVTFGASGDEIPFGVRDLIRPYRMEVTGYVRP